MVSIPCGRAREPTWTRPAILPHAPFSQLLHQSLTTANPPKPFFGQDLSQKAQKSERPRSLLLSLRGAIQTLAWVLSWARPGPIPSPRWSHPDSPCALFYSVSDPSRSRGGGHPGPSWSHPGPERSLQDRAWTGRNRLPGHFRKTHTQNPKLPKKPRLHNFVLKIHANFCLLPCDSSQEPNGNCSENNLFIQGGIFRVDFPPVRIARVWHRFGARRGCVRYRFGIGSGEGAFHLVEGAHVGSNLRWIRDWFGSVGGGWNQSNIGSMKSPRNYNCHYLSNPACSLKHSYRP